MKLKINQIYEILPEYKPQGKNYTIYKWLISGNLDGIVKQNILLQSFSKIDIQINQEFEVKENNYQGNISYIIQTEKKWNKKNEIIYTMKEYDDIFVHAVKLAENYFKRIDIKDTDKKWELIIKMASTYHISAIAKGVKCPELKTNLSEKNKQKIITEFDGIDVTDDDKIPF